MRHSSYPQLEKTQQASKELGISIHGIVRVSVGGQGLANLEKTRCSATRRLARKWIHCHLESGPFSGFHFFSHDEYGGANKEETTTLEVAGMLHWQIG